MEVGGHASAEGDDRYNLELSSRRARAVRSYLIKQCTHAKGLPVAALFL